MTQKQFFELVQNKLMEVSRIFSSNSTPLSREFVLKMSQVEIEEGFERVLETLKNQEKEETKQTPKTSKK